MNPRNWPAALLCGLAILAAPLALSAGEGFVGEAEAKLSGLEEKLTGLCDAMAGDAHSYRPSADIRSTSEVLLHVAAANYFVARAFGSNPPEGLDVRGLEKSTTDAAEIKKTLMMSFEHLKGAISKMSADDADATMKLFGQDTTKRGAVSMATNHISEHLGQLIAYARINGVTPPWNM